MLSKIGQLKCSSNSYHQDMSRSIAVLKLQSSDFSSKEGCSEALLSYLNHQQPSLWISDQLLNSRVWQLTTSKVLPLRVCGTRILVPHGTRMRLDGRSGQAASVHTQNVDVAGIDVIQILKQNSTRARLHTHTTKLVAYTSSMNYYAEARRCSTRCLYSLSLFSY